MYYLAGFTFAALGAYCADKGSVSGVLACCVALVMVIVMRHESEN